MPAHAPGWNAIRQRAIALARPWTDARRERGQAQTFWNELFEVFGIRRRTVASFEEPVRNLGGATDFIDLFWKGRLIAEHQSRGGDLSQAHSQAIDYIQSLQREGRGDQAPRYLLVSDFARIAEAALWVMDHPMNAARSARFGSTRATPRSCGGRRAIRRVSPSDRVTPLAIRRRWAHRRRGRR